MKMLMLVVCFVIEFSLILTLDNGLARTPPMGWMSWQRFRCLTDCSKYPNDCISEKLFRSIADRMADDGYLSVGYNYLIIDDCWLDKKRDQNGDLQEDRARFPSGLKSLSKYIHEKGLKFGLYEDFGTKTCAGYPGVLGNEERDIKKFMEWEVDYIKLDGCYSKLEIQEEGYQKFSEILAEQNRSVVFSCSWPAYFASKNKTVDFDLAKRYCNLWRNYDDIDDSFSSVKHIVKYFVRNQDLFAKQAGPGHWNDPDMLLTGGYGLSHDQSVAQMTIWCILSAPLLMSNDLRSIKKEFSEILLNKAAISVNQDPLGLQGKLIKSKNKINIWKKILSKKCYALGFVSDRTDGYPYKLEIGGEELQLSQNVSAYDFTVIYGNKEDVQLTNNVNLTITVNPTGAVFIKLIPKNQ